MTEDRWSRLLIRAERERRLVAPFRPQAGPQREFVEDQATQDIAYGGARGGGKTCGLLMSFREHARIYGPDAIGILFRRSYVELQEVIRQARLIYGAEGWRYHETERRWTSPRGATLKLGYLDGLADAEVYQGWSFTWQGFDELQNWSTSEVVDRLFATLRSPAGVTSIRRSTCNPGGAGHVWVKDRYHPDKPGSKLTIQTISNRPGISARFIPAKLEDNPLLHENDPDYELKLGASGNEALYRAWRYGDWNVIAGAFFDCWSEQEMTISARRIQELLEPWHTRWISMDWGFVDPTVVHWHAVDDTGRVITYRELKLVRKTPVEVAEAIVAANGNDEIRDFYLSPDAFAQKTSPKTIALEMSVPFRLASLPSATPADNDRKGGWMLMYQMLKARRWLISENCLELINALPVLQRKDGDLEDVADSPVDHAPDSARYGLKTYMRSKPRPEDMNRRYVQERMPEVADLTDEDDKAGMVIDANGQVLNRLVRNGRVTSVDAGGQITAIESDEAAAARWNRVAMLSRQGQPRTRRIRPKALPYGRRI